MAKLENKNINNEEPINDKPVIKKKRSLFLTILSTVSYSIIALVALILIIINLPVTKRYIANQAIDFLNKDLKMGMSIDDIDVNFFGDVTIKGLHIKDYKGNEFVKAKEMRVASDWMALAFNTRDIKFNQATVIEPTIRVITYKGDSISNFIRYVDNFDDGKPRDSKRKPFKMGMKFDIINGIASIINENSPGEAGKWLDARKVNLNVTSLKVEGADVSADIRNFNFITKRYGKEHVVDTFSTNFELTKKHLKLGNLTFNTDHSLLQGEVTMNLDPVTKFGDFGNKVKWDLKMIPGSQISGYDLSYFVPDWDNYTPINISGTMTGPLNDFTLNNFLIRSQEINLNTNKMTISSVLDKKFFIESKNVSADFTYKGLKLSLPKFISSKMGNFADDFGRLKYNGSVKINPKQVFATGNLITGIGQAKVTNFNLVDYSSKRPKFKGLAEVKDLNVTALTKNKQVGLISGKFNVQGEGFDVNTMYVKTTSDVNHIDLMGKSLNNISIDGILNKKRFTGNVNSNDAHAKWTFKGFVDFSTKRLLADFDADIKYVDLNYFGVSAGDTNSVSGHLVGKAAMTNLNDLNLDTSIQNLTLNSSSQKLHIPDSKIKAFFENGNRIVSVDASGAVNGRISGRFDLEDIGNMITNSINKIMVGNPPKKTYNGQNFDFDFDVKQGLVSFFVPNLELPDGAKVAGKYDGNTNDLILNADATKIKYVMTSKKELTEAEKFLAETDATYQPDLTKTKDSAMVDSLRLRVNTANFEKQLDLYAKRAQYAKNVLRDVDFVAANRNSQVLYISTTFELGTLDDEAAKKMKEYAVNINQTTNSAGDYVFRFEPTTITFNDVAWSVDTSPELNHSITYRNKEKDFIVKNLRIFSDESELLVKNADFKSAKEFVADAEVKNFDISKLLALGNGGENDMNIKGTANGTILVKKSGNNLEPLVDLDIENIFMNDKAMGNIETRITKSEKPNVFDVNIQALSSDLLGHNTLDVTGTIDNNPSSPVLDVSAKMDEFDLAFAQQFVKQIFGNFRGKATGDLKISGPMNDLDYSGDIALKGFGLKLLFTGVDYSFDDTVINLSRGLALLNNIAIKDGRSNSKGSISGSIQFETLSSLGVNLIMRADNLLVLNSTQEENDLFWGRVYGEGDVYVSGPVSGLEISTPNDGLKVINNSTFTFNSASTANVDEFKILRFLKRDEAGGISIEKKKQSGANMLIDFDVSIDKNSMVNVLVGDDVGSIAVKGDANHLKFRMERSGNILMNGTYTVDNGTFVSKAILDRTFQIARGSLIRWTGSPMLPDLDIKANYTRPITNTGEYLGMSLTQPVNIVLTTKITGTLTKPDIAFGVSAPDVSSQVRETLAEKMSNQDERVMQFGSILVLNSFNVASSGVPINVGNTALSQGVNMAFKQLGSVLNTISSNFQVNLDYITGDLGSNTSDRANTSVSLALSPRINFKTGLGVPIARTENTNSNYLSAEGTIEYDFSRANNGSRLLRAYSKPSNFGLGTATANALNQSYGVGVVYSRSFNSFRGLFRKRKNRDKTKSDTVAVGQNKEDSLKNKPIK
ncbi:translocation/assembly module TamB domain-containing protein [Epilithonimonas hispanica]|uniref:Translocation/assembly module TamB n=1 Tax=Epilithonimonas hispanica TaxID=358687 RepID=A0A3D9D397_9FLAO|nr:translocation/assembly module TamB [Epilithonimonas hispanica]REC72486.1 translocation/assembly module TamB [Epilithonimonas hispanica]